MTHWQERTVLLIGEKQLEFLKKQHVLVVGLGGVGAYAAENLCRAGIGELTIVDADTVELTNINRQLLALHSTLHQPKVKVLEERLKDINPEIILHTVYDFIRDEKTIELLKTFRYDYVVDAIDSLSPKVFLIYHALQQNYPLVSAMGAGGKLDATSVKIADIKDSYECRLAYSVRKRLHRLGVKTGFKVVFSTEKVPTEAVQIDSDKEINKLTTVGTISYMPAIFGCFLASTVIKDLLAKNTHEKA